MEQGRVAASGKNLKFAVAGQLITVIFNFVLRRASIGILGAEYTGFSSLCAHVLNFLSLLEPGFDAACIYCLYKPLAYGNRELVASLMSYIKKVYRIIGVLSFAVGILALPIVFYLSSDEIGTGYGALIYILLLFEMCAAYFFTHRSILPIADQKNYTVALFGYISFAVSGLLRVIALCETGSYLLYTVSGLVCSVCGEMLLYKRIGKMYPYIKKSTKKLPDSVRNEARSKAMSLLFRKAGGVMCGSCDNMAIFAFLGLGAGTVYSNYTMLSGICLTFVSVIIGSAGASVGNLGATNGRRRMRDIYSTAFFAIFVISAFFALSLFFTYHLIIELWLGREMVLDTATTALFCINIMISGMRRPCLMFIDSLGLFDIDKYRSLFEAAITVVLTVILTPRLGIKGVIIAQICAVLLYSFPREIRILFRHGFKESAVSFIREALGCCLAFALAFVLCTVLCGCTAGRLCKVPLILARMGICAFAQSSVFFILFFDSERLSGMVRYGKRMLGKG